MVLVLRDRNYIRRSNLSLTTLSYSARMIINILFVTHVSIISSVNYKTMKHCLILVLTECSTTLIKNKKIFFLYDQKKGLLVLIFLYNCYLFIIFYFVVLLFSLCAYFFFYSLTNTISVDYLRPVKFSVLQSERLMRCYTISQRSDYQAHVTAVFILLHP
jgi:hypothetical protein